jgi:2,4-dienoyl-CoA reductase-like NADH-dependent reductase (Old Yellow Enzyme family)
MMGAMTLQYGSRGLVSDRHLAFYRERALGGVGLMLSEQLSATPLSESPFGSALRAYDPAQVDAFARIAKLLQPFQAKFFAQLFAAGAAGRSTPGAGPWQAVRGPSRIAAPGGDVPLPLTRDELMVIARDFACSARNVIEGGLHGIEVHGAHGWLIGQFLSPFYNRRCDEYGGTVDNRCRFAIEVGAAIRAEIGPEFPLGLALTYDELMGEAGITPQDTLAQLGVFKSTGVFDFFDLSIGSSHHQHHTIASMSVPQGFSLPFGAAAKRSLGSSAAVFISGRIVNPSMAARAIVEGQADVVGMTRAHLADPHIVLKSQGRGGGRAITHCIGVNACVRRALADEPVACALNPVAGREAVWATPTPVRRGRRITVVGAGPAGLRFATAAAEAGHQVTLYERSHQPGGHLALLAALPTRQEWSTAVMDMVSAIDAAGGRMIFDHDMTASELLADGPDAIVVATGSVWAGPAALLPHDTSAQISPFDTAVAEATRHPRSRRGERVMIVDGTAGYSPLALADLLTSQGAEVVLVTAHAALGARAFSELELQHVMPRLLGHGVQIFAAHEIDSWSGSTITLQSIWGGSKHLQTDISEVVLALDRTSVDALYWELQSVRSDVHCIGDAASPREVEAVIYEAEALARSI